MIRTILLTTLIALGAAFLLGCNSESKACGSCCGSGGSSGDGETASGEAATLTSLANSIAPLKEAFNANRDKIRVVALLSPT